MSAAAAILAGCILAGALCVIGAVNQLRTGETWGGTGRSRICRAREPGYFWYLFVVRAVLGTIALVAGLLALGYL